MDVEGSLDVCGCDFHPADVSIFQEFDCFSLGEMSCIPDELPGFLSIPLLGSGVSEPPFGPTSTAY